MGGILGGSFLGVGSCFVRRGLIMAGMYTDLVLFYNHVELFCFYLVCVTFGFGFFAYATLFSVTGFHGITCEAFACANIIARLLVARQTLLIMASGLSLQDSCVPRVLCVGFR